MRVLTLCSGVEGIGLGFERAGMTVVGQVEIDPKCQDVLRRHYPNIPLHGDLKEFHGEQGSADIVAGGTPCQDLSTAGRRAGLDGDRSALFYEYARVVAEVQPEWVLWENVPGALTSGAGRDMGTVLQTLVDLGYGVAYRVLDAQYFGVAQRRRRVVLVGRRGDIRGPAEVLALTEGLPGDPPTRQPARPTLAAAAADGTGVGAGLDARAFALRGRDGGAMPEMHGDGYTASTLRAASGGSSRDYVITVPLSPKANDEAQGIAGPLLCGPRYTQIDGGAYVITYPIGEVASTLLASLGHHGHSSPRGDGSDNLVATYRKARRAASTEDYETWIEEDLANTLNAFDNGGDVRATTLFATYMPPMVFDTKASSPTWSDEVAPTLRAMNYEDSHLNGGGQLGILTFPEDVAGTLTNRYGKGVNTTVDDGAVVYSAPGLYSTSGSQNVGDLDEVSPTLKVGGEGLGSQPLVVYAVPYKELASTLMSTGAFDRGDGSDNLVSMLVPLTIAPSWGQGADLTVSMPVQVSPALTAGGLEKQTDRGLRFLSLNPIGVRRLTPRECIRLQGFPDSWLDIDSANATEAHADQVLRRLWLATYQTAREGWRPGILASLLTPEVLLAGVYGGELPWSVAGECAASRGALPGAEPWPEGFVRGLRHCDEDRSTPHRRESFEQLAGELGRPVSELPLDQASCRSFLLSHRLWPQASQEWPLRHARSESEGWSSPKPLADSHRYRMMGNSVAVPVFEWVGRRIMAVQGTDTG